jgi:hypothetical protein
VPPEDAAHRDLLRDAASALYSALEAEPADAKAASRMTPEEEVLLLHVME